VYLECVRTYYTWWWLGRCTCALLLGSWLLKIRTSIRRDVREVHTCALLVGSWRGLLWVTNGCLLRLLRCGLNTLESVGASFFKWFLTAVSECPLVIGWFAKFPIKVLKFSSVFCFRNLRKFRTISPFKQLVGCADIGRM